MLTSKLFMLTVISPLSSIKLPEGSIVELLIRMLG